MKKLVSIDYDEYIGYSQTIDQLRTQISGFREEIQKLQKEISFLKDSGENILVIVKHQDKPDVHEYKSNEKNILTDLVQENYRVRERYDELSREKDKIENQNQLIILKYREMENIYKNKIIELDNYISYLEDRSFIDRIKNKKKEIKEINFIEYDEPVLLEVGPTKTIYSEDELKRIEEEASKVEKPKGWNFKKEFMDSEGNVYHKGKLQPHLKGTL